MLGSQAQLCAAFFHTERCYEAEAAADAPVLCLAPSRGSAASGVGSAGGDVRSAPVTCERQPTTVLVALLQRVQRDGEDPEPPLYECRYTNCFRGSVADTLHAEQAMMADAALLKLLRAQPESADPALVLTMYLTQQPCHFASGRVENARVTGQTSCTHALIEWRRRERLVERGVDLAIRVSRLFRAQWTDDSAHQDQQSLAVYGGRAGRARDGLRLLMRAPGVSVSMLNADDWRLLLGLCDGATQRSQLTLYRHEHSRLPDGWAEMEDADEQRAAFESAWVDKAVGTEVVVAARVAADTYYAELLNGLQHTPFESDRGRGAGGRAQQSGPRESGSASARSSRSRAKRTK